MPTDPVTFVRLADVLLFATLPLPSCQDPTPEPTPESVDAATWAEEWPALHCAKIFSCCGSAEWKRVGAVGGTASECTTYYRGVYRDAIAAWMKTPGGVGYRGDIAARCLARTRAASCAEWVADATTRLDCLSPLDPPPVSGACEEGRDCRSSVCESGTCAPPAGLGGICLRAKCGEGLWCGGVTPGGPSCIEREDDGKPCRASDQCKSRGCEENSAGTLVCGPRPPICKR